MYRTTQLTREAIACAGAAAATATLLVWLGPPGTDLAAHVYQRTVFLQHGFALWNNFWYAGRYSFVTYSLLYYPLAGLLGIKLLGVATIATAALAFTLLLGREWGTTARWSSRTFAVLWGGIVLSGAYPFALGTALALLALLVLQRGSRWWFGILAALTLAASPLAFLLLALVLAGIGVSRWSDRRRLVGPAAIIVGFGAAEVLLWRLFRDGGRYPFSVEELAAACAFCLAGALLAWREERARLLRWVFVVYLAACLTAYLVPSSLGENIARLRFASVALLVLVMSLRNWRPLAFCVPVLALALSWNVTPYAFSFVKSESDPAAHREYWRPATTYLKAVLTPAYRVEAVDTAGHWDAVYLPGAGIPLARGWFRQNDFPQNKLLYSDLVRNEYVEWLRGLGVGYVVLPDAPLDYSARAEAALLRTGRSGLRPVFSSEHVTVFKVPRPRPMLTGPGAPSVLGLSQTRIELRLHRAGLYRLAVRHSPYWRASTGCLSRGLDGMVRISTLRPATVTLAFHVDAHGALGALAGRQKRGCP
ncbi:MAG: hypothetical protein M3R70_10195 [Actinomycetota bacterium]|nr:hypothetical protein [Actinomycetota bacterium]